ncbi:MAG: peptidoglycan editing factor PgeF [Pseudomonadota bacterium]
MSVPGELALLTPVWPEAPANIGALATTRRGGVSVAPYDDGSGGGGLNLGVHVADRPEHVRQNRTRLQAWLPSAPVWLTQVHGDAVLEIGAVQAGAVHTGAVQTGAVQTGAADALDADPAPALAPQADASFTRARGAVCAILTADCLPLLFADVDGKVVGAAHAGWRGLAGGVLGQTLRAMRGAGAGEIVAWMGPAIGARRFEVGPDVLAAFLAGARGGELGEVRAAFSQLEGRPDKYLADIYALARLVLRRDGVERVAGGAFCTVSQAADFYSYRRDGVTGRQASLIWRR